MGTARTLEEIKRQLDELTEINRWPEARRSQRIPRLSAWSVAEQLDHAVKVKVSIIQRVIEAKPLDSEVGINALGRVLLRLRWLPRGRGKSPENLRGAQTTAEQIDSSLAQARELLLTLRQDALDNPALILRHPVFRGLNAAQSLDFSVLHTHHHLKIIREIVAAN